MPKISVNRLQWQEPAAESLCLGSHPIAQAADPSLRFFTSSWQSVRGAGLQHASVPRSDDGAGTMYSKVSTSFSWGVSGNLTMFEMLVASLIRLRRKALDGNPQPMNPVALVGACFGVQASGCTLLSHWTCRLLLSSTNLLKELISPN